MKNVLVVFMLTLVFNLAAQDYPPQGWTSSFEEARELAEEEGKYILLNFTGSDWCVWCHRLWDEVFGEKKFNDWAEENAVLLFLDFPSSIALSDDQQMQNAYLQQFMGVQGYPSIWLVDSDLTPLLVTGYQQGGADSYIEHLENDRIDLEDQVIEDFKSQLTALARDYFETLDL
ncbi:MAG: thioredoxin family protein [Spirochaetaceae bacterium]|jgi:protein disulfide-isomerase|nr:thioredoxin family protein [Spirochaetaceae bacterium]